MNKVQIGRDTRTAKLLCMYEVAPKLIRNQWNCSGFVSDLPDQVNRMYLLIEDGFPELAMRTNWKGSVRSVCEKREGGRRASLRSGSKTDSKPSEIGIIYPHSLVIGALSVHTTKLREKCNNGGENCLVHAK